MKFYSADQIKREELVGRVEVIGEWRGSTVVSVEN
jgi:predicted aconitase with swiveling domain